MEQGRSYGTTDPMAFAKANAKGTDRGHSLSRYFVTLSGNGLTLKERKNIFALGL